MKRYPLFLIAGSVLAATVVVPAAIPDPVKLDTGLSVKLPRKVSTITLERLESLLANSKIAEMALETIDLRLSNRTILQLRDATLANRDRAIASLTSAQAQVLSVPRKGKAL